MSWVFEHSKASGNTYVVLLALADHADEKLQCFPGHKSLAKKARVSVPTVKRCLARLVDLGELEVIEQGGGRKSNRYLMPCPAGEGVHSDPPHSDPPAGSPVTPQPVHLRPPSRFTAVTPESSYDPHLSVSEPSTVVSCETAATMYSPEFDAFWVAYGRKGNKAKTAQQWKRLPKRDCTAAHDALPHYHLEKPERQYRLDAERYLRDRRFENYDGMTLADVVALEREPVELGPSDNQARILALIDATTPANTGELMT